MVTDQVDGMPHRVLRTELVEELEETSRLRRLGPTGPPHPGVQEGVRDVVARSWSATAWRCARQGPAPGRRWLMAANTPMLLKAGLVEGDTDAGVLASGQVVGVIDDLPSCAELVDRIVTRAVAELHRASSYAV